MKIWIQYHDYDEQRKLPNCEKENAIESLEKFDTKYIKIPTIWASKKNINKGDGIFLIVGITEGGKQKKFYVWSYFKISEITPHNSIEKKILIIGDNNGIVFNPPILLNNKENFNEFKTKCGNFGFGLTDISKRPFVDILESLRNQYLINDEKEKFQGQNIESNSVKETEKDQVIKIRIGQSEFRNKLIQKECKCKICRLEDEKFLIASHIKPWRDSDNEERLDVYNGFLLCPHHDALFDKGYITFDEYGKIIISSLLDQRTKNLLNIHDNIQIEIEKNHKKYINWHRENKFKK